MSTHDPEKLEAAIHRALRSAPDRKAPASLQGRVFAELNRRAALPWWRKSYAYWPAAIRGAFFLGSALAAALAVSGLIALLRNTGAAQDLAGVEQRFAWLGVARDYVLSARLSVQHVIALIPPLWFYGAIGTVVLCYVSLAAIGAATYRALTFGRQDS
jgi:hypothetical protein